MDSEPLHRLLRNQSGRWLRALRRRLGEEDKRLHVRWSFWMTMAGHVLWPAGWAVAVVFIVGLAKEFWDQRYGSGFCFVDLACNLIGIVAAAMLCALLPKGVFS